MWYIFHQKRFKRWAELPFARRRSSFCHLHIGPPPETYMQCTVLIFEIEYYTQAYTQTHTLIFKQTSAYTNRHAHRKTCTRLYTNMCINKKHKNCCMPHTKECMHTKGCVHIYLMVRFLQLWNWSVMYQTALYQTVSSGDIYLHFIGREGLASRGDHSHTILTHFNTWKEN